MLTDLFETITLWAIKTQSATTRPLLNGQYEVPLNVYAQKLRADEVGRESPTPMNDRIEVAAYGAGKPEPIYQTRHLIKSGQPVERVRRSLPHRDQRTLCALARVTIQGPSKSRTPLGERLREIRAQIIGAGVSPLAWDGVENEVARRRGGWREDR